MYQPNQLVLAKIKGFPDWPAIIVPKERIPAKLSSKKFERTLSNYLSPDSDSIVVKFYFDDQYSWTKLSNLKPLNEQIIDDYLLSVGDESTSRGGRKKRITEAYLKVKEVPVDEFLEYGSWGKPKTPEPELEADQESLKHSIEHDGLGNNAVKRQKKKPGPKPKRKPGRPPKSSVSEEPKQKRKPGRPKKDAIIETVDDEKDVDYTSSVEDAEEEIVAEEEDEDDDEEEEEEEEEEEDSPSLVDTLASKKPEDFDVNFNEIPLHAALVQEVNEMTSWCTDLRLKLQKLILPLKEQERGNIPDDPKSSDKPKEDGEKTSNNVENDEVEEIKPVIEVKKENIPSAPIDYKKLCKSIDELIDPLLSADLSKSILKSSGLSSLIYIILLKPEFQISQVISKKLNLWWYKNFNFNVIPDNHWSDGFTIEMHLNDESERRAREEEKKRKRKEERKSQSVHQTPDVEQQAV